MAYGFQSTLAAYCGEGKNILAYSRIHKFCAGCDFCLRVPGWEEHMTLWSLRVGLSKYHVAYFSGQVRVHVPSLLTLAGDELFPGSRQWVAFIWLSRDLPCSLPADAWRHKCQESEWLWDGWAGQGKSGNNATLEMLQYQVGSVKQGTRVWMEWIRALHFFHQLAILG